MVKRNKFWTVVFSFLPGAGHMFMGFMRQGTSIMVAFFGIMALASWLGLGELSLLAPVLWFYSFFDCINKRFSTHEQFVQMEDKFLFEDWFKSKKRISLGKFNTLIAVVLIVLGIYMLVSNTLDTLMWYDILSDRLMTLFHTVLRLLPRLAVSVVIIIVGIKLITGKKKEMKDDE